MDGWMDGWMDGVSVCLELEEHLSNLLLKKPLYITTTAT
jgi:hypothetical protein